MSAHAQCPTCGASLADGTPAGLCANCLLGLALDTSLNGDDAAGAADAAGVPSTIAHYAILERVGRGGMGEVWLARDTRLDRRVALKLLPARLQYDAEARARFLAEARAAAALDHPYICHIHEVGSADGLDYIAMEYVEGTTLADLLREGPPPLEQTLRYALAIAEALEAAHEKLIVHRDLKPANIMVTRQGHIKIMDFGLAKRLKPSGQATDTQSLSGAGKIVGTVAYMAPEQVRAEPVSTAADLFAFGIVLYELLAGVHPFSRPSVLETAHAILADEPPAPPTDTSGAAGRTLAELVALDGRMLAKRADARGSIHATRRTLADLAARRPGETTAGRRPATLRSRVVAVALPILLLGSVLAFEHLANRPAPAPAADRREVYVTLAFDRWGTAGEDRLLLEVSKKLRGHLEQVFTALPSSDVVVRPEVFDADTLPAWSYDRSPARVVAALRELDVPVDLVLRNRLEQPEPGTVLLLSSIQRLQGERLVGTGRFVRAEGAQSDLIYLTLRVAFGFWEELQRDAADVFTAADRREIGRRVLGGLQEVLARHADEELSALVDEALAQSDVSSEEIALLLDAHGQPVDTAGLADRIAARRRANLTKLKLSR